MLQSIKRILGQEMAAKSMPCTSEGEILLPEASLKRAAQNMEALTEALELAVEDAVILNESFQVAGKALSVEVRTDKIMLQDPITHESRLIRLDEGKAEPYQTLDIELRLELGRRIARLTPQLAHAHHEKLLAHTVKVLKTIAQDQSDRVRLMVAEELADLPNAPYEVIQRLAQDSSARVACPILEFSPLLSDDDLMNILEVSDVLGASEAIARRKQISSNVADAIIAREEEGAIGLLLENEGACISEAGLNAIIALAPKHPCWHESLAHRPELTQKTVARIAQFISQDILMNLEESGQISRKHKRHSRAAVQHRLGSWSEEQYRKAEQRVRALHLKGALDDEVIDSAINSVDEPFVTAALAMRAMMTREKIKKILRSESARAITALAWEAGLPMRSAYSLQMKIGQVHHTKLIHPRGGTDYPLSPEEMEMVLGIFS